MARVELDQLVKSYPGQRGGTPAVRGVSLAIADGELMVLVGPSGCGKSTLLRLIAGLEAPDSGTVSIDGKSMNGVPPKDRDLAMVFQNYALYPHLTVFENLAFGLRLRKLPRAEIDLRVRAVASQLGLEGVLDRLPKSLSGGQRQRVAVGRAIVRQPKVFLFDEPLSNLDAKLRAATRAEIARLHQRLKATMIYVTHDQVEAMTLGDRICVLREGEIMQVAPPLELYRRPANLFVAGFIGDPPMNLLTGMVADHEGILEFRAPGLPALPLAAPFAVAAAGPAGRVTVLGFRPEHVHVGADEVGPNPLPGQIELVEPMGVMTHLHLRVAGQLLIARVPPAVDFAAGQSVPVAIAMDQAHIFDQATGLAWR
jgi:multiple sugar transport system ATP-binding protein